MASFNTLRAGTGSSKRLRLIRQTGPMSSGVTRNSRPLQIIYLSETLPP